MLVYDTETENYLKMLTLNSHQVTVMDLIGANGAGKSTFLKNFIW